MKLKTKRSLSYIIDMIILFAIACSINLFSTPSQNEIMLGNLNESLLKKEITYVQYKDSYIDLIQKIDLDNVVFNIVSIVLIVILFIVIPKLLKGQTIGQKIMKLKTTNYNLFKLFVRAIIINGLGYMIFMVLAVFLVNKQIYFILINFLGFCQVLLVIINAFMILYKKDQLGMVDIITNTRIEEIK